MKSKKNNVYSDFWLDDFHVESDVDGTNSMDTQRMIKLSMARRAISNFVNILTNKTIPVIFNSTDQNMTDGKTVFLSADIVETKDFDYAVGLALHEGSHIYLTDFDILHTIWQNIPRSLYNIAESKGYSKSEVCDFVKQVFNYVEDRYIDNFIYNDAPGYRGYYKSLYDKYFHNEKINIMLKSKMFRLPTIDAYDARLINLTNEFTDLDALPGLRNIAKVIDLQNIDRLKTTDDRFSIALDICNIIYQNVLHHLDCDSSTIDQMGLTKDIFESGSDSTTVIVDNSGSGGAQSNNTSDKYNKFADEILGGNNSSIDKPKDDNTDELNKKKENVDDNNSGISKTNRDSIYRALKKQHMFTEGNINKKKISKKENEILGQLEKSGVKIVDVGMKIGDTHNISKGVECIIFKNVTKELLMSGTFPCSTCNIPDPDFLNAVDRGIQLGMLLGRRLKVRNEINLTKYIRKNAGKIDRNMLAELGFENENIFYKMDVDKFKSVKLHISIDASSSMYGEKWIKVITTVTAICKAASMINNLEVMVSVRSTTNTGKSLPFVGIVYDSTKDSFIKVKTIFPYLCPYGCTPEGLCYEAIMNYLGESTNETDYYFLNFSDGQPAYAYYEENHVISYNYQNGGQHTRRMVNEIRNRGYKVLSYFISEFRNRTMYINHTDETCFKMMYGTDAKFIDVTNIINVANTMNQLFLSKS